MLKIQYNEEEKQYEIVGICDFESRPITFDTGMNPYREYSFKVSPELKQDRNYLPEFNEEKMLHIMAEHVKSDFIEYVKKRFPKSN